MKKIILIMLIGLIPFITISQKRTKKNVDSEMKTNKVSSSNFMVIKGVQIDMSQEGLSKEEREKIASEDVSLDRLMKKYVKPTSKLSFDFDTGKRDQEVQKLMEESLKFRTMAQAVHKAMEYGWEFVDATVVMDGPVTIHYYYMKR